MKYGLKDEIYDKILNIARKNKQYKFILFGSRARGKYKKESDIDIAIKGNIKTEDKYRKKSWLLKAVTLLFLTRYRGSRQGLMQAWTLTRCSHKSKLIHRTNY